MSHLFDTEKEDAQLAAIREREEEDLARILSEKYDLPYIDVSLKEIDADALRLIPEADARAAEAAAFQKASKALSVAVRNPHNPALATTLENLAGLGYSVKEYLVSERGLEKILARYKDLSYAVETPPGTLLVSKELSEAFANAPSRAKYLAEQLDSLTEKPALEQVSRVIELVFASAAALRASDIHFETEEARVRVRLRIDGLLSDVYFFDAKTYHLLDARLKILSGVKLNVGRAQDGRFTVLYGENAIEVRSSFIPGAYGESLVMRLLDPKTTQLPYTELGIHPKLLARLEIEIRRANGMLLTTGPTGSGKTTTLYSFLRELEKPTVKIITIEDPIEYHLNGIQQTQVSEKYTFADGLATIVRQDPEIIMVGEIRDDATAGIAIEAALTGHFVFTTLHTNDAAGTFPRLADLSVDPKSFGSAITVSMAQRLVRRLDPDSRTPRALTSAEKEMITRVFEPLADKSLIPENIETVWEPAPKSADDTGYRGRVGLYEAIFMNDSLAAFLRDNPPAGDIRKEVAGQGYPTMAQDGILKALAGLTSLAEVGSMVDLPV
jgi:type IV pilus assembly protein PilB